MKKVSILLLLTVVLTSFTFAIEGVGDFEVGIEADFTNVGGANEDKLGIELYPYFSFARSFGAFGLSAKLADSVYISTVEDSKIGDDLYFRLKPSYTLAAGPGELGFALTLQLNVPLTKDGYGMSGSYGIPAENMFFRINPSISYGLDADFGALSFELATEHLQISKAHGDTGEDYGLDNIKLYLQAGADLSFGLGFWVKPYLVIDTTDDGTDADVFNNFDFDIHYVITEAITAGVETSIPTVKKGIENDGITIKPYGNFSFGAVGAYVQIAIGKVANDVEEDIEITPIVGVSYSF